MSRSLRCLLAVCCVVVLAGGGSARGEASAGDQGGKKAPTRQWLRHGDGKAEGRKSIAGAGQMVRFERPEGLEVLRSVKVHGARYGYPQPPQEDIEVTVLSADMTESLHTELVPYKLFKRVKKNRWTTVPFRDPAPVPEVFWVVFDFNAERNKGVYVSYDTSTGGEHSRVGLTDEDAKETAFGGDWMVQALLTK